MTRFNILSLSGGGFMGLYTAHVLAALEERSGRPLRESFDLVAGTSVGGILALGIAKGVPARHLIDAFERNGTQIFSGRRPPSGVTGTARDALRYLTAAKYSNEALRATIVDLLGDRMRLRDLKTRCIAPVVNLSRGAPVTFRTPHLAHHTNSGSLRAVDVALATSAAPTFFPIVEIEGSWYCDGGLYANSPDHIAMHEAESLIGFNPARIHVLSIGTTSAAYDFPEPKSPSFGLRDWLQERRIVRMALAAQQQSAHRILKGRLGQRYIRLDAIQGPDHAPQLGLDIATPEARHVLRSLAGETTHSLDGVEGLDEMLSHCAPPVTFFRLVDDPEPDPVEDDPGITDLFARPEGA